MAAFNIFNIQLQDATTGKMLATAGTVQVNVAGTQHKATLYNPDSDYAALANPITIAGGRVRFAVSTGGVGQATPMSVDVTGITTAGYAFSRKGCKPGAPTEIYIHTGIRHQTLSVPFAVADCTAGTEKNTGLLLPAGALVLPNPVVYVTVAAGQGSKTIELGLLSSESGGDLDGFVDANSLTTIATLKPTITGAAPTLGALLRATSLAGAESVPEGALIAAAVTISYTITSSTTLAEGYVMLPYMLTSLPSE